MGKKESFAKDIIEGYSFKGDGIILGAAILDGEAIPGTYVKVPLKTMNRHGLIASATFIRGV